VPYQVPRHWRHRLVPKVTRERRARGLPSLWLRVRWIVWAPWLWGGLAIWLATDGHWWRAGLCAAVGIIAHFGTPQERAPTYGLDHEMAVDSPGFFESIVGLTGFPFAGGNRLTILNNGVEFYPAMLDAIRRAQQSITIEAYIYWHGEIGMTFARALSERARAGVEVKILLDALGSATIGREILEELERGRCQLAWFNPVRWRTINRINYRTHRKTLLVDGWIAFTGGAGIADQWLGNADSPEHWRDIHLRLEGPGAVPLQTGFAQNWLETTGEVVSGPAFFPEIPAAGPVTVQTILSSPSTGTSGARLLYYLSIVCARRSILIANPYFVPDQAAIDTFADATRRGVKIRIMVAGPFHDNWFARHNSLRLYGDVIRSGVELYEYTQTMLHQKTMVVDGLWATIGTTNFDSRSFTFNEESNVSFYEPELVAELEEIFERDLQVCRRITLEEWERRSLFEKASEIVASLFQEQS
jgi:cardiolipin synthase